MGAEHGGGDSPGADRREVKAVPIKALLADCMFVRDAKDDEDERFFRWVKKLPRMRSVILRW